MPKPPLSFDLDGVICRPPLGINIGISRRLDLPPLKEPVVGRPHRSSSPYFRSMLHWLRYAGRSPLPDARDGLLAVSQFRQPVLVTARNALVLPMIEAWLRRHHLRDCFSAVHANDTSLRAALFKLHSVRRLAVAAHVDDDGATAYYLASHGLPRVYLRDWPGNRDLPYPESVRVIDSLLDLARLLEEEEPRA